MPFRNFAPAPHQVSTALSTQQAIEDFVTRAADEDENDTDYALDYQGNRHFNRSGENYNGYTLAFQKEQSTPYQTFDLPGLASANRLRDFLRNTLQPSQVANEYGDICDLYEISVDHLAVLQAKIWSKASSARSPSKSALRPSRAQVLDAGHVSKISQLLEDKHIFVLSKSALNTCQYLKELQINPKHACQSQIVQLEPLVHWGTATPAIATQSILAFRRDGELMQETGYYHLVRRLVNAEAPAYCVDCLDYLWRKRTEARDTMRQLQCAVKQLYPCKAEVPPRPQMRLKLKDVGELPDSDNQFATDSFVQSPAYCAKETEDMGEYEDVEKVSGVVSPILSKNTLTVSQRMPQLDGASDGVNRTPLRHKPNTSYSDESILISSDADELPGQASSPGRSVADRESFTLPLRNPSISPRGFDRSSPLPELDFSTTPQLSTTQKPAIATRTESLARTEAAKDKTVAQTIDLITPPRVKLRKFGSELTTNTKLRRSPRNHKTKAPMSKENSCPPVRPMKSLGSLSKITKPTTKETKKRKIAPLGEQPVKLKKPKISTGTSFTVVQRVTPDKTEEITQQPAVTEQKVATHSIPEPKLIVNFAKRPTNMVVPDGVATLIYEDFLNMSPAPAAKICWCNKPAGHSTSKRNDHPHVAQCTDSKCRFRWYHYACLNISDKGKARFGNLVCQLCRNDQEFTELGKKNGWNATRLIDFTLPWKKEEVAADISSLSGYVVEANPYGLGLDVDLDPKYQPLTQNPGTLGSLDKFGLIQSHPYMLEEAYLHPDAYAALRAEKAEEELGSEGWLYETRAVGKEITDVGEVFDEMEEEL